MSNFFSDNEINLLKKAIENKKHIHIKNKSDRNRDVMNVKDLNNLISMHNIWDHNNFNMVIDKKPISFNKFSTEGNEYGFSKIGPDPKKVQYYIKKGASLVLNDIIYYSKEIKNIAFDLQEITNGKCQANLYFSMQNRQAFGPHFDTHDVFALHCDGEKTWNVYETLADNPINHPIFKPSLEERTKAAGEIIEQVNMKPGDILYIPRGKYHDALASESGAIHIAFGILYVKPIDIIQLVWDELIINPFLRSDIREIKEKEDLIRINNKISEELEKIFKSEKLLNPIMGYLKNWSYNFEEYNLMDVVRDGVNFEVSNVVSLRRENDNLILKGSKNSVKVPEEYKALTEFSFEKKLVSSKMLKEYFPDLPQSTILKFIESMKEMRIFI